MIPEPLFSTTDTDWLRLRAALWPECSAEDHLSEMATLAADPNRFAQFIVRLRGAGALGFAEASIRNDYVNGTSSSPVAFLEGLYVIPDARRRGVARTLVDSVAQWALAKGCTELASDTQIDNTRSQAVHRRLGFAEAERVVCFNKPLKPQNAD